MAHKGHNETAVCFWCGYELEDGCAETGYTGDGFDWGTPVGLSSVEPRARGTFLDYGCDAHPISGEEGVGPHETETEVREIVRAWHEEQEKAGK